MVNCKRLIFAGVFLVVVLMMSFLVSGFFHKDVQESPVDVGVAVANAPPSINSFIAVFEDDNGDGVDDLGGTDPGTIQPFAGGTEGPGFVTVRFQFVAEDPNGVSDLPGLTGPAIVEGTNLIVTFTEPANDDDGAHPGDNTVSAVGGDCSAVTCVGNSDCVDQSAGTNEKEYICDIRMNYYDPPALGSVIPGDLWTISATVVDIDTNLDTAQSGDPGFNVLANDFIEYLQITAISTIGALGWASLDINTADQPADAGLVLDNVGNVAVIDEGVSANNLLEDGTTNGLAVAAFSAGPVAGGADSGACDSTGGGGGSAFCLWSLLSLLVILQLVQIHRVCSFVFGLLLTRRIFLTIQQLAM